MSCALALLLGGIIGSAVTVTAIHYYSTVKRLGALEEKVTSQSTQKRWSHSQLDQIERLKFLLGRHMFERKVADEYLSSMYHELGEFYQAGPNSKK